MKKGFTLIELLIVIAIIGILAGIVLVSVRSALFKARDSRIQSSIAQVRYIAEMIMNDSGSYAGLCSAGTLNEAHATYGTQLGSLESDITNQGGSNVCLASATDYCVKGDLVTPNVGWYCVDSRGQTAIIGQADTDCTGADYTCEP